MRRGNVATDSSDGVAVLSYFAVMSRWKWLIIGITLACLAAGFGYLLTRTPLYRATAKLLYVQPVTISNPLIQGSYSQTYQQPDIATVSAMVSSGQVTSGALQLLEGKDTSAGFEITASQPVDSSGNSSATVVGVEAVSADPQTAADAANATARAFVDWRRDSKGTEVQDALAAVEAALKTYTSPAARESAEYLQLKQSQQALELQLGSLSSDFTVIAPASVPTEPFSPRTMHTLALAGSLGLILGMVLAFLLNQLDTRVRDERQMTEMLGMSTLGHLPPLLRRTPEGAGVQMLSNPSGPMAEAIRVLRGNLSFTGVDGDVRSVLVTSSIRSEGKSVTASNLAVSLALAGQRVVLVDADFRRPRIHSYMRVSNAVGLSSVLARRAELSDAVIPISLDGQGGGGGEVAASEALGRRGASVRVVSLAGSGRGGQPALRYSSRQTAGAASSDADVLLRVLPSGPLPPNPGEMAASKRFGEIIGLLADTADWVIVDTPPLLEVGDAAAMASKADGAVFVVNMSRVRWPMLERSHAQLEKFPCRKLGMVVVAAKHTHGAAYGYEYRADRGPRGAPLPTDRQ
jgi:Mrp family chromosome partitioning ATPase/capsular polysaccharide biosynthesis protein